MVFGHYQDHSPVQSATVTLVCAVLQSSPGRRRRRRWRWRRSGEPPPLRTLRRRLLLLASAACPVSLPPSLAPHHDPCRPSLLHPPQPLGAPSPGCASTTWPRSTAPPPRPTRALSTPSPLPSRATAPPPSTSLQRTPLSCAAPSSPRAPSSAHAPASMSTAPGGTRSQSQYDSAHSVLSPHFTGWRAAAAAAFPLHLLLFDFYYKVLAAAAGLPMLQ